MVSADGQLVISFNGEIYNYRQLKKELEAKGRVFRTESDTEVLLHLYAEKGEAMLHDLRGMYAFALWDARKASPAAGARPVRHQAAVLHADDGDRAPALRLAGQGAAGRRPDRHRARARRPHRLLPVGQRARALHAVPRHPRAAGRALLVGGRARRLRAPGLLPDHGHPGATPPPTPPGHQGRRARRHWRTPCATASPRTTWPTCPWACFLSAGIDSALITALSSAHGERPHTLTLAFAEYVGTPNDEAPLAEQLAAQLGTRHATVMVRQGRLRGTARAAAGRHGPAQHRRREHLVRVAGRRLARHQGGAVRAGRATSCLPVVPQLCRSAAHPQPGPPVCALARPGQEPAPGIAAAC